MSGGKPAPDELVLTPPDPGPAPGDPIGRTEAFVFRVRQTHGEDFVAAWLSRRTCDFTRFTIRTTPLSATRLRKHCGLIAAKFEVQIIGDPQMEIRLANANRDKVLTSAGSAGMRRGKQRG
jgi:hypothetical protein